MNKTQFWFVAVIVFALVAALGQVTLAQQNQFKPSTLIGLTVTLAWAHADYGEAGYIKEVTGINWLVGFTKRFYSGTGLRPGLFNFYWGFGTLALILPYIEWGFTYVIPLGGGEQLLNIDIGFLYLVAPHIGFNLAF